MLPIDKINKIIIMQKKKQKYLNGLKIKLKFLSTIKRKSFDFAFEYLEIFKYEYIRLLISKFLLKFNKIKMHLFLYRF